MIKGAFMSIAFIMYLFRFYVRVLDTFDRAF